MLNPLRSGNADRYCDYHQEKGHYTNDCIQLRKQLEMALESRNLNHLVKDVRQKERGSHSRDDTQQTKIINVISVNSVKNKKRKITETTKSWMNIPISFPAMSSEDVSKEPLIAKAEVEGYLVRRVPSRIRWEVSKPLGKIEAEVCFDTRGLCRRTSMKFIMVRSPSPYNIILGRPGLKALRAIPSTIHSMMKFPTPKRVATLVTRTVIIVECRRLEKTNDRGRKAKGERRGGSYGRSVDQPVIPRPSSDHRWGTVQSRTRVKCETLSGPCMPKAENILNREEWGGSKSGV
uniref:Reverse transcriptase domain-containing protein n=1 Tax=Tanacetum cinerariifolium TaxID=118510 RepID=A0A699GUL2_TANCI|nr:reverse transcriptase domain-containing protein [Tanacetum cinerariifolium]GEW76822.1 reverse transcriptase domain-containing protein [Tanacetum cinerariifolium]